MVAESGGGGAVNANRTQVGAWERFDIVDLDDTVKVALKNKETGYYLKSSPGEVVYDPNIVKSGAQVWKKIDLGRGDCDRQRDDRLQRQQHRPSVTLLEFERTGQKP